MTDFQSQFQSMEQFLKEATHGIFSKIDSMTFKMTVNCLKSNDLQAACIAIDQLAKEKRPLSVAPLYMVSQAHPNDKVRAKAIQALALMGYWPEVEKLTAGKSVEEGTKALIMQFGNFRQG